VGGLQAGVGREASTANKSFAQAPVHRRLEQVTQNLAKPAMPIVREGRVVRNLAIEPQATEPTISEVEMNFFVLSLGPDGRNGADAMR
jgi:hypothetical protein